MYWYRSWPSSSDLATISDDRPRVIDDLPKIIMSRCNYKTVAEYDSLDTGFGWPKDQPGFCMLEWDIALDPIERRIFAAEALLEPREILVAPYRFWDTWVCWINNDGSGPTRTEDGGRPIQTGETRTDSFGLGCIYFPNIVLREFLTQMDHLGFTDGTFGKWYHHHYGPARVTWNIHPQHLHPYNPEPL